MSEPERKRSINITVAPKVADIPEDELPPHIFDLLDEIRKVQRFMKRRGNL